MKIYLTTYADEQFKEKMNNLIEQGYYEFDYVESYNREWLITTEFYIKNKNMLDIKLGGGCYLWKPYIIIEQLNKINYGDVVFYLDSGKLFNRGINNFLKYYFQYEDYLFCSGVSNDKNSRMTRRDCFILMNCDEEKYYEHKNIFAGCFAIKKTNFNINLIYEWLIYCSDERINGDEHGNKPSIFGEELPDFNCHRWDQSVLTNLLCKYNLKHYNYLNNYINYTPYQHT